MKPDFSIEFFSEDIDFELESQEKCIEWLTQTSEKENVKLDFLNFIFCSDNYLLDMNRKYLNHDYYTDIITFDSSDNDDISGDVFISIDRATENAVEYAKTFEDELRRLIIHGVLHLIGYKDSSDSEKQEMRQKEDYYLSLWAI